MYVILWGSRISLYGWDWFWLFIEVVLDLMYYSSTAYYNRNRLPGYKATSKPVV